MKRIIITSLLFIMSLLPTLGEEDTLRSEPIDIETIERINNVSKVTTLGGLIQEAVAKNPVLLSLGHQIHAQDARTVWKKAYPDPNITNSHATSSAPFRYDTLGEGPMNQVGLSLGQKIPFPGKLKLKGKIETSELKKIKDDYMLAKLQIVSRLKNAYYDLFFSTKSLEITEEIKGLLESIENTVKAKYEVGTGNQHDLLKVQLEISGLLEKIEILRKDREASVAEINAVVIRPQGSTINKIEDIQKQPVSKPVDDLLKLSSKQYPLLLGQKARIEKSGHSVRLAKREYFPDFAVEAGWGLRTEPFPDMYTVQVMTSLPIFFRSKQRKQVEDALSTMEAEKEKYHSIEVEAAYKIKDLYIQAEKHEKLIDLLDTGILPQARLTVDSSIAAYKVDNSDFLTLLDSIRSLLNYQIEYYEHLTKYQKAIADLEPLIGAELGGNT